MLSFKSTEIITFCNYCKSQLIVLQKHRVFFLIIWLFVRCFTLYYAIRMEGCIMKYSHVISGRFISRPNRFIAIVESEGTEMTVHVKNTGRCRELLIPGTTVYLSEGLRPGRKTAYDLIAVEKQREDGTSLLINMDSQIVNDCAEEWLRSTLPADCQIRREYTYGKSRFDFLLSSGTGKRLLEVKGVTLEENGMVRFPDAPTTRGVKHLYELIHAVTDGYKASLLFVIQMKNVHAFSPNDRTDPKFGKALRAAADAGVQIIAMDCQVTPESIRIDRPVPILL